MQLTSHSLSLLVKIDGKPLKVSSVLQFTPTSLINLLFKAGCYILYSIAPDPSLGEHLKLSVASLLQCIHTIFSGHFCCFYVPSKCSLENAMQ